MSNVPTVQPMLPPNPPFLAPKRSRATLLWAAAGSVIAVLVAVVVAATLITVPYVIIAPGQTYVANDLVAVPTDRPAYPPDGQVRFVTVSERVNPTLIEKLLADHDGDAIVLPREEILPHGVTEQQNDLANQLAMSNSKDVAALVALKKLGFDVRSNGVFVSSAADDTPAGAAGVESGEVIFTVNGQPTSGIEELRAVLATHRPGTVVSVEVESIDEKRRTVMVTLGANPDPDPERNGTAFLGIAGSDNPVLPVALRIDTTRVGGPSAGLAFTLAILDVLTPGELTGGAPVAATGEIAADGTVGPIGGIEQKVVAVGNSDVDVFLVPADNHCGETNGSCNYTDARNKAGDDLTIIPVASLDEALSALSTLGGNALALGEPGKAPTS